MAALTTKQQKRLIWIRAIVKIKMRIMIEKLKLWDTISDIQYMGHKGKNETERTGIMDQIKYFITCNYGKIGLFIMASMLITGGYKLAMNLQGLIG